MNTIRTEVIDRLKTLIIADKTAKELRSDYKKEWQRYSNLPFRPYKRGSTDFLKPQLRDLPEPKYETEVIPALERLRSMDKRYFEANTQSSRLRRQFHRFLDENIHDILANLEEN